MHPLVCCSGTDTQRDCFWKCAVRGGGRSETEKRREQVGIDTFVRFWFCSVCVYVFLPFFISTQDCDRMPALNKRERPATATKRETGAGGVWGKAKGLFCLKTLFFPPLQSARCSVTLSLLFLCERESQRSSHSSSASLLLLFPSCRPFFPSHFFLTKEYCSIRGQTQESATSKVNHQHPPLLINK